jgi:hypothetical protein
MPAEPYVRDFTFSPQPFGGRKDPPWDEAKRTGTVAEGARDVYFRVELAFFDGGPMHVLFLRPDGSSAFADEQPTQLEGYRATWADFHERLSLDETGRWRIRLVAQGRTLVDAPFDVVASRAAVRNRPPNPISVEVATPSVVPSASSAPPSSPRIRTSRSCATATAGSSARSASAPSRARHSRTSSARASRAAGRPSPAR